MPQLPAEEARRRFTAARVARLATVDEAGRPHLVPVVFAVRVGTDGSGADGIVMAVDSKPKTTTRLKRLRNIAARPAVCLLVDSYGEDWGRLWWVRADGEACVLPPAAPADADAGDAAGAHADADDAGDAAGAHADADDADDAADAHADADADDAADADADADAVADADDDDAAVRAERRAALGLLCDKYPQYRDHPPTGPVVAVTVLRWTGWRAGPTA